MLAESERHSEFFALLLIVFSHFIPTGALSLVGRCSFIQRSNHVSH